MSRLVICGVPKAGKTTHAATLEGANTESAFELRHTDDLIGHGWSEASELVASQWFKQPGPWVIEGVAAVRALRKAMIASTAKPCDAVLYMGVPHVELNAGQAAMAKGVDTVWREILPRLKARGVKVYESIDAMQKAEAAE